MTAMKYILKLQELLHVENLRITQRHLRWLEKKIKQQIIVTFWLGFTFGAVISPCIAYFVILYIL